MFDSIFKKCSLPIVFKQIHEARHLVSHIPHNFGPADQQEATERVKNAARYLNGGVSPEVMEKFEADIKEVGPKCLIHQGTGSKRILRNQHMCSIAAVYK